MTDARGNVYFSDNNCVFKVDNTGTLTRLAGTGRAGYSGDGGVATNAQLNAAAAIAIDPGGNVYIADEVNARIRRIGTDGIITTVAGNGTYPAPAGDGGLAKSAGLYNPSGVAIDSSGNLYIADTGHSAIRKVSPSGVIGTFAGQIDVFGYAGDGGPANQAQLYLPTGVTADGLGDIYISEGNARIRKVSSTGTITTIAGNGTQGYSGDGGPAVAAQLSGPSAVAVDGAGNLYFADINNNRIRQISGGAIRTVAMALQPSSVAISSSSSMLYITTGDQVVSIASNSIHSRFAGNGNSYSGDGGPAIQAQLADSTGVAIGSAGNLFLYDYQRIRTVSASGVITTFAGGSGGLGFGGGLTIDSVGNLFAASTSSNRIQKISSAGAITTIAGSGAFGYSGDGDPAVDADLGSPTGVSVDRSGNIFIADYWDNRIRRVDAGGTITTVAGTGIGGFSGDGGVAVDAQLGGPTQVVVDNSGSLYVTDQGNNRVRKIDSLGNISTIAGNGSSEAIFGGGDGVLQSTLRWARRRDLRWTAPAVSTSGPEGLQSGRSRGTDL